MKILNTKMRIFILTFALVALGGATTGMFFATSQNESVLASETDDELLAYADSCGTGEYWNKTSKLCSPKCLSDETLNTTTNKCEKLKVDIDVTSVKFKTTANDINATLKREELASYKINVPEYTYEPAEATNAEFVWTSSDENVVRIEKSDSGTYSFRTINFGSTTLRLSNYFDETKFVEFNVTLTQDKTCPAGQTWKENIDNGQDYGKCETPAQITCDPGFEYKDGKCTQITCEDGYELDSHYNCVKQCGANSTRDDAGVCVCNEGYEEKDGQCVEKPVVEECGENQFRNENGVCVCNDGYEEKSGICLKVANNARAVKVDPESASSVFKIDEELTEAEFLERLGASVIFDPLDPDDADLVHWTSKDSDVIEIEYPDSTSENRYAGEPTFTIKSFGSATLYIEHDNIVSNDFIVTTNRGEILLESISLDMEDKTVSVLESDLKTIDVSNDLALPKPVYTPGDATNIDAEWFSDNSDVLIATKICNTSSAAQVSTDVIKATYEESVTEDVDAEISSCEDGQWTNLFIPVGYGDAYIYLKSEDIESNKVKITIEKSNNNDTDGDGIIDDLDDDIDGDGYLNEDDALPYQFNVGDRDLLMFATLAYDPVNSSIDRISGDTKTENGKTVKENFQDKYGVDATPSVGENGYAEYFNYICSDRTSNKQAEFNECMYNEDQLIGMQAQEYSGLDGLIKAWQTVGKDYYFGGSSDVSISEVNQWVITDHVSQKVTFSDKEGYMEATTFRLNNNIVIAYRGTDFTDLMEWLKDVSFVSGGISGYEDAAKSYAKNIFATYAEEYYADPEAYIEKYGGEPNFYITGHSLGGYLTQIGALGMIESNATGLEFLRDVVYFNGMGMGFFGGQRLADYTKLFDWANEVNEAGALLHKVICYHVNGDPVSALGRHVNEVGYYASEGAITRHATQNVSKLQSATRNKLADGFVNVFLRAAGMVGEFGITNTTRLSEVSNYLNYYSALYGENFEGKFIDDGTISVLDLMWFCHEPSASLFANIKKGTNGHSEVEVSDTKLASRDYLKTDETEPVNDDAESIKKLDWYGESVNITSYDSDDKKILTAQVTGDVTSYTWYKDDAEVGHNSSLQINKNDAGSYYVDVTVKSRRGNNQSKIELSTEDSPISVADMSAPTVTVSAINDIWSAKTDSTIVLKVTAKSASGFSDGTLDPDNDLEFSSLSSRKLTKTVDRIEDECDDQTEVWSVTIKSTGAATLSLVVKDDAFVSKNDIKSESVKSGIAVFTNIASEEDKKGPQITIEALNGTEIDKTETLKFKITATDEGGIKDDNLKNKITTEPALANISFEYEGEPDKSSDGKTISYIIVAKCNDDSRADVSGQIYVKLGAFVDQNGNKSQAEASKTFKFKAPADKIGPTVKITSSTGEKTTPYGGSVVYNITVEDESGLDQDAILTRDNVLVSQISPWIEIYDFVGPTYNTEKTVASYKATIISNSRCSDVLGCSGTIYVEQSSVKDTYGNGNTFKISDLIVFASEIDRINPTVTISPEKGRKAEIGETLTYKVVAYDKSGIEKTTLSTSDFKIGGINDDQITIESVSEPFMSDDNKTATYTVTVRGNEVWSAAYINLPAGKIKDNNGNWNSSVNGDIMTFTKPVDLTPPHVEIEAESDLNVEAGDKILFTVTVTDNDQLQKNRVLTDSNFYILDSIKSDVKVSVGGPEYLEKDTKVVYKVTVSATKSGSGWLQLKYGSIADASNNKNLLTTSKKFTFKKPDIKDTKQPEVKIEAVSGWSTKRGKNLTFKVTVTDDVALDNPTLTENMVKKYGNNNISVESVTVDSITTKTASWIVTVSCADNFGFGQLVKDATLNIPKGTFKDTSGNESGAKTSSVLRFTKY